MKLSSNTCLSQINFNASKNEISPQLVLRRIIYDINTSIQAKLWIQGSNWEFFSIDLEIGQTIELVVKDIICPYCHKPQDEIIHGRCRRCTDPDDPFLVRMSCLFRRPYSVLETSGYCLKQSPSCGFPDNTKFCHSDYILYLGRFGNLFKVGISRKKRRGGYIQRLIEQGLQEAYVISSFDSMIEAQEMERTMIDLGFLPRIEFNQKFKQILCRDHIQIHELYPVSMIEELFPRKDIFYEQILDDLYLETAQLNTTRELHGEIIAILGKILVLSDTTGYQVFNLSSILNSEIEVFEIDGRKFI